jgi:hypothetical protein
MEEKVVEAVRHATTVAEVQQNLITLFAKLHAEHKRIGYVAGILFSDGPEFFDRNVKILEDHTTRIRSEQSFPIFSSIDVFYDDDFYNRLPETTLPYDQRRKVFFDFWRAIVGCGYVTDIFMTPRWEKSEGARDEYETAKKHNLKIHIIT